MVFARKNKALTTQASERLQAEGEGDDFVKQDVPEQAPPMVDSPSERAIQTVNPLADYKFGIADRLLETVATKSVLIQKRSPDLVPLSKQFDAMRKRLRQMISTAKKYHESMIALDKDRMQMAKEMSSFAEASPIESHIGSLDQAQSFLSVYQNASNQLGRSSQKYQQEVIDYCVEWEAVITTRIDREVEATKKLREMFNHYQGKVDALRKKVNAQQAKGKGVNDSIAEKLQRNEEKLDEASSEFETAAGPLCVLIEEVVHQGWKDLYPMIQATMKWEADRSQQEAHVFQLLQPGALEATFRKETGTVKPVPVNKKIVSPKAPSSKKSTSV